MFKTLFFFSKVFVPVDLLAQKLLNWRNLFDAEVTHNYESATSFGSSR